MPPSTITPTGQTHVPPEFSPQEVEQFQRDGYIIARGMGNVSLRERMIESTLEGLEKEIAPVEYEAELHYPGAPDSMESVGGKTIRRLKQAHARGEVFTEWLASPDLTTRLRQLLGQDVVMPLAHHNCIMTKQPQFSSDTGWHQDIRYWAYENPELVSVWFALGIEDAENGCLRVIPGTHRMNFDGRRLDEDLFLRTDLPENQQLISQQVYAQLDAGDVLFFHARTFHAASRNHTDQPKFSAVFTFRPANNPPQPGTRSASLPELIVP